MSRGTFGNNAITFLSWTDAGPDHDLGTTMKVIFISPRFVYWWKKWGSKAITPAVKAVGKSYAVASVVATAADLA